MLYTLLRLNKNNGWEPVCLDLTIDEKDRYFTDDKDWLEKFHHDMSTLYCNEVYCIAEVHLLTTF